MAGNGSSNELSNGVVIIASVVLAGIILALILLGGELYVKQIDKNNPITKAESSRAQTENSSSASISDATSKKNTNIYSIDQSQKISESDVKDNNDVYEITSEEDYNSFVNNPINKGKIIRINAEVYSTKNEIEQDNEIWFNTEWAFTDIFIGSNIPSANLNLGDMVIYTGEFTGEYEESTSSLTGKAFKNPIFSTIEIGVNGKVYSVKDNNDVYVISSEEEYELFVNDTNNKGKTMQMKVMVMMSKDEIEQDNEISFSTIGTNGYDFIGTVLPDIDVDLGDMVVYTGEFTGEFNEVTSSLTGQPIQSALFITKEINMDEKAPSYWGNPDDVYGIEKYEDVAIKDNARYSQFETDPNMEGVSGVFKVQVAIIQPKTNYCMFHIDGRDTGINAYGTIDDSSIKERDWVYVIGIYTNTLPHPVYGKGLIIDEVIKIQ